MIKDYAFTIVKSKGQKKPLKVAFLRIEINYITNFSKVATKLDSERTKIDIELSKELIECLDKEKKIEDNKLLNNLSDKSPLYQLDICTLYLRKVHSYCFFCAGEHYDERMLSAKCGPSHLRLKIDPVKYLNFQSFLNILLNRKLFTTFQIGMPNAMKQ